MKTIFKMCLLIIIFSLQARAESFSTNAIFEFPEDAPSVETFLDAVYQPFSQLSYSVERAFTITQSGPDCRIYQGGRIFTVCVNNNFEDGLWTQRLTYIINGRLPYKIVLRHDHAAPVSHKDLFQWKFPMPKGKFFMLNFVEERIDFRFEKSESTLFFRAQDPKNNVMILEGLEERANDEKFYFRHYITDSLMVAQVNVMLRANERHVIYQLDDHDESAPHVFREIYTGPIMASLGGAGQYLVQTLTQRLGLNYLLNSTLTTTK